MVSDRIRSVLVGPLLVFVVVLASSMAGTLTRRVGFLAAIWPANAILLGLIVRTRGGLPLVDGWPPPPHT